MACTGWWATAWRNGSGCGTRSNSSISTARVRSFEPSLITTISNSGYCSCSIERTEVRIVASSLKAGMSTDTGGSTPR